MVEYTRLNLLNYLKDEHQSAVPSQRQELLPAGVSNLHQGELRARSSVV